MSRLLSTARAEPRPPIDENGHSFSWQHPRLEVRDTERYGKGIFAREPLERGEVLFVIGGSILTCAEEACLPSALLHMPIEISERFSIGPRSAADLERMPQHYVNHSCDPNAGFQGQMLIVAIRAIRSGEEITYDYAMCLRPEDEMPFRMECRCGSSNCRRVITGEDWKRPELQHRYAGYFQWYLQEKINGLTQRPRRAQRITK